MSSQDNPITDFTIFQKEGLENVHQAVFAKKNLIIGKNGSGKTRFLKALEQDKKQGKNQDQIVITLYFPEIQAFYSSISQSKQEEEKESFQEIYPYDLLFDSESYSFYDFLKIMENDKGDFLENILSVLSMKRTKKSTDAKKALDELNELLAEFLNKTISISPEDSRIDLSTLKDNTIRTLPLKKALSEFSPGELMLFYLCVFLMIIQKKHTHGAVLIIDEPELHLHPRALVKMMQILKASENISELWIASHSLFLVPLFEFEEIVFIEHNTIFCRNSHMYKNLYDSLVGLENIDIFEFLKSLDSWQYYQFIAECFCLPESVNKADVKDEQFCKLLSSVRDNLPDNEPLRMLDYGAGKFRIWECMQLLPDSDPGKSQVIYTAYEPYPKSDEKPPFPLYLNFSDILKKEKNFHVVVLMNVLHEIEGGKWHQTFREIFEVLDDHGVLIFLEVLSLTKGEQPYGNNGYLVLQDEQVKILFDDPQIPNMRIHPKEKSNCWIITKKQVGNVSMKTIKESISSLSTYCQKELEKAFKDRINYAHGSADRQAKQIAARRYAFLSQQYINAMFTKHLFEKEEVHALAIKYNDSNNVKTKLRPGEPLRIRVTGVKKKEE
ncbi:MAG: AAA family ATPase [Lachnospiraceae bacterium]|nr:AAA family ATPase [Lachnospiraceae bacterium]